MDRKDFTIIIVDDEKEFRQTLSMIIESERYSVLTSSNGHDALNQIKENDDIRLVLTDLKMPGMGGMELIKEIHAVNPSLEIIVPQDLSAECAHDVQVIFATMMCGISDLHSEYSDFIELEVSDVY